MADALFPIVPYTSLAVYEADWSQRVLVPLLATGRYVQETLRSRPAMDDSITGRAALRGEVVCLDPGDPLLGQHVMPGTPRSDVEAILVAPLIVADRVVGTLNVWREDENPWFLPEEAMLLRRFASLAAMAYANSAQRERLRVQALKDELTGLSNRRHCEQSLSELLEHARDHEQPTSIVYFDIDDFKTINDTFGHAAGDDALCGFAGILRAGVREGDIVCRTGGEEFTLILPDTPQAEAVHSAERLVTAIRAAHLGPRQSMTVSAGVASTPASSDDPDRLMRRADANLLRAKREGRDRVVADGG
jgi:diguanylate cyclase (GGDEF)-like protein